MEYLAYPKDFITRLEKEGNFNEFKVKPLSLLKPAATQLILFPDVYKTELIKFTFFDLLFKRVIQLKVVTRKSHPRDLHYREYTYIEAGPKFGIYKPEVFEAFFLNVINTDDYFLPVNYLREVYSEISDEYVFNWDIIIGAEMDHLFNDKWFCRTFRLVRSNSMGKQMKKKLKSYFNFLDEHVVTIFQNHPEVALQLVKQLQSNLFFLKNFKFEFFEHLKGLDTSEIASSRVIHLSDSLSWMDVFVNQSFDSSVYTTIFDNIDMYVTKPSSSGGGYTDYDSLLDY